MIQPFTGLFAIASILPRISSRAIDIKSLQDFNKYFQLKNGFIYWGILSNSRQRRSIELIENNVKELRISTLQQIVEFGLGEQLELSI